MRLIISVSNFYYLLKKSFIHNWSVKIPLNFMFYFELLTGKTRNLMTFPNLRWVYIYKPIIKIDSYIKSQYNLLLQYKMNATIRKYVIIHQEFSSYWKGQSLLNAEIEFNEWAYIKRLRNIIERDSNRSEVLE